MRFLLALLLLSTAAAVSSKDVLNTESAVVFGPVKQLSLEQRYDAKAPFADFGGMNQTLTYDRQGQLVHIEDAYYEGFRDVTYEYTGTCLKRRTEESGYAEIVTQINVYFPDKSCNTAQYAEYEDGKMVRRTVITKKGNTVTETSYKANNSVARTQDRTCTADGSGCQTRIQGEADSTAMTERYDTQGKLKYLLRRTNNRDGTFYEAERAYDSRGRLTADRWTYSTLRADDGSELLTPKLVTTRYTHRYGVTTDQYGNWLSRQDYRVVQSFGKTSEVLDGITKRKFTYY